MARARKRNSGGGAVRKDSTPPAADSAPVEVDTTGDTDISDILSDPADQDEAPITAREPRPSELPMPPVPEALKPKPKAPTKMVVAPGKGLFTLRGILGAGAEVRSTDFSTVEEFTRLTAKGFIVEV